MFENIIAKEGMEFLAWREVPIAPDILENVPWNVCRISCSVS